MLNIYKHQSFEAECSAVRAFSCHPMLIHSTFLFPRAAVQIFWSGRVTNHPDGNTQQYNIFHIARPWLMKLTTKCSDWHMPIHASCLLWWMFPAKLQGQISLEFWERETQGNTNTFHTAAPALTSKASPPALRWWDWPKVSRIHRSWIERHGRWRWERERMVLPGEI